MSTDDATGGEAVPAGTEDDTVEATPDATGGGGADGAEPTPGSDNDGAEAGYTPPSQTQGSAGS
jgi:hypothetical protein